MSRYFGEIRQVAYLVPDIEAAMDHWSRVLGVGPWYYNPKVPIRNYHYRGQRYEPHNSVALANAGGLQIELLQPRNDVPSMYRDFMQAGHRGVQHVAYWTEDFDADLARAEALLAPVRADFDSVDLTPWYASASLLTLAAR